MDRYEVMTGKMMPLTDGAHRKWGFTGKVVTRSYERLVDALIDFVEMTISIIGRDGSVLLDERFRPTVKTEWPHASAVNGIYPEDVADLPTIETAIPRLREIFAGADEIIGYNVGFDLGFLSAVGVRPREDARITDTMNLFT